MDVELHAASAFSFLRGSSLPEDLVNRAAELGYRAVALVDRDGVSGAPRFFKAARAAGIRPLVGAELTLEGGGCLPLLVASRQGYRNLCQAITRMKAGVAKGKGAARVEDLEAFAEGLVALPGVETLGSPPDTDRLARLLEVFGPRRLALDVQRHRRRAQEAANQALLDLSSALKLTAVATGGVRHARAQGRPLLDVFTCIREKRTLASAGRLLGENAERHLRSPGQMAALYRDRPDLVRNSEALAERLEFTLDDLGYRFPDYPLPAGETAIGHLCRVTEAGARERYRPYHERARRQVERELALIGKLDLAGYFLIVWDIVNFCRREGILVQGRGSAANSAVCYGLGITAVDPVGMDLLFERFLSEERDEWPDIDLDLPSGDRRERVIQHVYGKYGARSAAMTANVITYRDRSASREIGKVLGMPEDEIARLSRHMRRFEWVDPRDTLAQRLERAGLDKDDRRIRVFARLFEQVQDLPRHLGQHSGGMVIAQGALDAVVPLEPASMPGRVVIQWDKDDCALLGIVKVDLLGLGMMSAIQDCLALLKDEGVEVDLAHLPRDDPKVYAGLQKADTVGLFQVESRAQMATLPRMKPERFYDLVVEVAIIRPGPIVGKMVHPYLNRRAGREAVSYPHPSLEPILKRTLGVPLFQEQLLRMAMAVAGFTGGQAEELRRALGFKRSVRRMAEIEVSLREGMAKNGIAGEAAEQIIRSISSFALYGFPESHAASFALIAYASAYLRTYHAAAFTCALLNNQPMGFYHPLTLVKDAQRHGVRVLPVDVTRSDWNCTLERVFRSEGISSVREPEFTSGERLDEVNAGARTPIKEDANGVFRSGALTVAAEPGFTPGEALGEARGRSEDASDRALRLGLRYVAGLRQGAAERIAARREQAPFSSLQDFVDRAALHRDELQALAELGALNNIGVLAPAPPSSKRLAQNESGLAGRGEASAAENAIGVLGLTRRSALWQVERACRPRGPLLRAALEEEPDGASPLPEMDLGERLASDLAGSGMTVGPHPMALYRRELASRGVRRVVELEGLADGSRVTVAGAVICRQRPGTAQGFMFLTLEDESGLANVIVRPDLFDRRAGVLVSAGVLEVSGVLQAREGVSVRAIEVRALGEAPDLRYSRDFR